MATVEKIRKDIEKTKEKISAQQKRLRELEAQLTEEENLEIVRMVKAVRMDNKELTAFLKAYASGLITLPDGMMEAEAAADPDDADVEGMEDGEDEAYEWTPHCVPFLTGKEAAVSELQNGTMESIQECRTYTVNEVARILGVSTNAVYRLIPENLFRSVRIGSAIRISKRSFDHWLESLDL